VRTLYGPEPAAQFSPKRLQVARKAMVDRGRLCRREINDRVRIIVAAFKWAVSQELVPADTWKTLESVEPIGHGQLDAREGKGRRQPVAPWVVDATLLFLRRPVAAIIQLLRLTGARPSEILSLRPSDIDRSEDSAWLGSSRSTRMRTAARRACIVFDARAQSVLRPFLARAADRHLFRPVEAVDELHELRRQLRLRDGGTPIYRSHVARLERDREQRPRQEFAECYGADSLRQAIERAVVAANRQRALDGLELLPRWWTYQLRHTFGTYVRDMTGDTKVAAVLLGHGTRTITDTYLHPKVGAEEAAALVRLRTAERGHGSPPGTPAPLPVTRRAGRA
jgi:integrase